MVIVDCHSANNRVNHAGESPPSPIPNRLNIRNLSKDMPVPNMPPVVISSEPIEVLFNDPVTL